MYIFTLGIEQFSCLYKLLVILDIRYKNFRSFILSDRIDNLSFVRSLRVAENIQWVHFGHTSVPFPELDPPKIRTRS